MKIGIIAKIKYENLTYIKNILHKLLNYNLEIFLSRKMHKYINMTNVKVASNEELFKNCDIIIVVGGDGTIIKTAKLAIQYDKAILGINGGNIGFNASIELNQSDWIKNLIQKNYKIRKKMVLTLEIDTVHNKQKNYALNDIVISKKTNSPIVNYKILKFNKQIMEFNSDGVIFSTPMGSTAYALSAGGPILDADSNCINMVPICPHTFIAKPIIFGADTTISVKYTLKNNSEAFIIVDGKQYINSTKNSTINITKAPLYANFIEFDENISYKNLKQKSNKF